MTDKDQQTNEQGSATQENATVSAPTEQTQQQDGTQKEQPEISETKPAPEKDVDTVN